MPPVRPTLKLQRDAAGQIRAVGTPDRAPAVARAGTTLSQLTRLAEQAGANPTDVQPVVEVMNARGYARWRSAREAAWQAEGGQYGTGTWPAAIAPKGFAALMLPLAYGAADGSPVVAEPLFTTNPGRDGSTAEDVALYLLAEWLRHVTAGPPLRLAPMVLVADGERRTVDFGLAWPLAPSGA